MYQQANTHRCIWCCSAAIAYRVKADVDQAGLLKPDFKKTVSFEVLQHSKAAGPPQPLAVQQEECISYWSVCVGSGS